MIKFNELENASLYSFQEEEQLRKKIPTNIVQLAEKLDEAYAIPAGKLFVGQYKDQEYNELEDPPFELSEGMFEFALLFKLEGGTFRLDCRMKVTPNTFEPDYFEFDNFDEPLRLDWKDFNTDELHKQIVNHIRHDVTSAIA